MKQLIENLKLSIAGAAILAVLPMFALAQYRLPVPPEKIGEISDVLRGETLPVLSVGDTSERSIKVDSSVNLSLCVTQGTVNVNGWSRSEVRVYVQDGSKFAFNVRDKNATTGDPNWIKIMGLSAKNKYAGECISGGEIEIDVPLNATVSIKGEEATTRIDSVRRVDVKTIGGSISLRNIAGGVSASAGQGGVTVEASSGPMMLETTTGNIVVFEAGPTEIGEPFRARTNGGNISLQMVQHRQIDVGTISGSVLYNGNIRSGGSYNLSTSNGSIRLVIPLNSSALLTASYGAGNFKPDIPLKILTEDVQEGPIKRVVVQLGTGGDARLKLTTNNGSISISKQ